MVLTVPVSSSKRARVAAIFLRFRLQITFSQVIEGMLLRGIMRYLWRAKLASQGPQGDH